MILTTGRCVEEGAAGNRFLLIFVNTSARIFPESKNSRRSASGPYWGHVMSATFPVVMRREHSQHSRSDLFPGSIRWLLRHSSARRGARGYSNTIRPSSPLLHRGQG
jgi:hypothetical protein